ncbi:MAG: DUF488 domain-containing protein [Candidatus Saccharimonadales bacterium]
MIQIKRAYQEAASSDGYRVLVDRLWPRGVSKDDAKLDVWLKEVGPSTELRQWFGHKPERFKDFAQRYKAELKTNPAFEELDKLCQQHKTVTLVYSAKDEAHNQAVVLQSILKA